MAPPTALTAEETDLSAEAIEVFTAALGGRAHLLEVLQVAGGNSEIDKVTNLLIDPRYATWSLRRLCTSAGLTIAELFAAYKKALLVKAHLQAAQIVTAELVAVVEDVMRRAQPHDQPCDACQGLGTVAPLPPLRGLSPTPPADLQPIPCDRCRGTGQTHVLPDLDRQKLALELGQLVSRSGGISLTQQTVVAPPGSATGFGPGAIDQLQQAVGEVLRPRGRGPARVVDVDVTPAVEAADADGTPISA